MGVRPPDYLVSALTDQAEQLMLHYVGRTGMAKALGQALESMRATAEGRLANPDAPPMPLETVDDYIRRVKDRWEAEPLPNWVEAQKLQVRRIHGQIRQLIQQGRHGEIEKRERLLSRIEGTEAVSKVEVSGPGGAPLPAPASAVSVVVHLPDNGKLDKEPV